MSDIIYIGKLLILLRNRNHLSQKELAEKLHVTPAAVCRWEHGKSAPGIQYYKELAEIFHVNESDFLHPEDLINALNNPTDVPPEEVATADEPVESNSHFSFLSKHKIACISCIVALCSIVLMIFLIPIVNADDDFRIIAERTMQYDSNTYYELSMVCKNHTSLDKMMKISDVILEQWEKGLYPQAAFGIRIYFYDNEEQAAKWGITNHDLTILNKGSILQ